MFGHSVFGYQENFSGESIPPTGLFYPSAFGWIESPLGNGTTSQKKMFAIIKINVGNWFLMKPFFLRKHIFPEMPCYQVW